VPLSNEVVTTFTLDANIHNAAACDLLTITTMTMTSKSSTSLAQCTFPSRPSTMQALTSESYRLSQEQIGPVSYTEAYLDPIGVVYLTKSPFNPPLDPLNTSGIGNLPCPANPIRT